MTPPAPTERYKNHRFPREIISHGIWLYGVPAVTDQFSNMFENWSTATHRWSTCARVGLDEAPLCSQDWR